MPFPDTIISYSVRIPGEAQWSEHKTEKAAHHEAKNANRVCRPGHKVYANHISGACTGPCEEFSRA